MSVLSVQSGVAAGYVGNSAASFCLQRAGVECWRLDTVRFSNHTGYDGFTGGVFRPDELKTVFDGLKKYVGLERCQAVLSGYLGSRETGGFVLQAVSDVRSENPAALYCCDPVLGDDDGLYVSEDIVGFMREKLIPAADIIFPNRFELGLLSGLPVGDETEVAAAARSLMETGGAFLCVVTGVENGGEMISFAVSRNFVYRVATPFVQGVENIGGAGDATAALFLAEWLKSQSAERALALSVSSVYGILRETAARGAKELCLIEAQREIQTPSTLFFVNKS